MHGYIDCGHLALQLIVLDFNSTGLLVLHRDQQCNAHAIRRQTKCDQYAINKAINTNAVSKNFNCRSCSQALQTSPRRAAHHVGDINHPDTRKSGAAMPATGAQCDQVTNRCDHSLFPHQSWMIIVRLIA
jgi:hypothetical protein